MNKNMGPLQKPLEGLPPLEEDIYDCYKELATAIVAQAIEDYITALARPSMDEECAALEKIYKKARAYKRVADAVDREHEEEFRRLLLGYFREVKDNPAYTIANNREGMLPAAINELEHREIVTNVRLKELAQAHLTAIANVYAYKCRMNADRKHELRALKEFLTSENFYFYTGGLLDAGEVLDICERKAAGRRNGTDI